MRVKSTSCNQHVTQVQQWVTSLFLGTDLAMQQDMHTIQAANLPCYTMMSLMQTHSIRPVHHTQVVLLDCLILQDNFTDFNDTFLSCSTAHLKNSPEMTLETHQMPDISLSSVTLDKYFFCPREPLESAKKTILLTTNC
jgi:hypothetical protein